nr:flavin reductase family protein [uncultured Devosia sp.]
MTAVTIDASASADRQKIDGGDPSMDPRQFRQCLAQFATGVTIVTTNVEGELAGVTANSFSSLSLDPPLILWSIGRTSRSFSIFERAKNFAISVLGDNQVEVSQHFSSKEVDKFAGAPWRAGREGVPLIEGAIAHFECAVENILDGGDHIIIVGRVASYGRYAGQPLLFSQGRYGIAEEHPNFAVKMVPPSADGAVVAEDLPLLPLLFRAYHQMSAEFDEHRRAEGTTISEGRTLAALYQSPDIDLQTLLAKTFLGRRDAEDAVRDLTSRGLLMQSGNGQLRLTNAGVETRLAISRRWEQFQNDRLSQFSAKEKFTTKDVLSRLIKG